MRKVEVTMTIGLVPVTKKNSQQILKNAGTGRPFIAPSRAYREYAEAAAWCLRTYRMETIRQPVEVKALFYMPTRRKVDLTNLLEALDDVLVEAGVLEDDHSGIIVSHDGSRVLYDKQHPRTEIVIRTMEGGGDA